MKRAFVLFLMCWFVLQAGLVQAHVAMEDVHRLAHATGGAQHGQASAADEASGTRGAAEAGNASDDSELCGVAHCCHSAGLLLGHAAGFSVAPAQPEPTAFRSLMLRTAPADIERPKWRAATLAVADLRT